MLSLLRRMVYGPKKALVLDVPMMRDCHNCKKCVTMFMANRLATHLIQDHKLSDEHAYETVNQVFDRLRKVSESVNLIWNPSLFRFEAQFSSDFQGDLAAVKAAGFKTDGAPSWTWYAAKAASLNKLRENRPASGLTISPDAKAQFASLWADEERNAKVKAELKEHNKALKKTLKNNQEQQRTTDFLGGKEFITAADLSPIVSTAVKFIPPPPPETKCIICGTPVYFYERQDPPTCLWDEKIVLDKVDEVC